MSPTVLIEGGNRYYFFSREEERMHIHVYCADGEAKYWLTPKLELANNYKIPAHKLKKIEKIIEEHHEEFRQAWVKYFTS